METSVFVLCSARGPRLWAFFAVLVLACSLQSERRGARLLKKKEKKRVKRRMSERGFFFLSFSENSL